MDVRTDSTAKWYESPEPITAAPDEDSSFFERLEELFHAGREMADAEVAWAKARAAYIASAAAWIAGLGAAALILALGLIVTLMVGSVLALAPHIGLGLAVAAVCAAAGLVILLCLLAIKMFVGRIASVAK